MFESCLYVCVFIGLCMHMIITRVHGTVELGDPHQRSRRTQPPILRGTPTAGGTSSHATLPQQRELEQGSGKEALLEAYRVKIYTIF